jgi:hypothetical protein
MYQSSFKGVAIKSLLNAISTPPAPSLLSFLLTISYPEFSGKIAASDGII